MLVLGEHLFEALEVKEARESSRSNRAVDWPEGSGSAVAYLSENSYEFLSHNGTQLTTSLITE